MLANPDIDTLKEQRDPFGRGRTVQISDPQSSRLGLKVLIADDIPSTSDVLAAWLENNFQASPLLPSDVRQPPPSRDPFTVTGSLKRMAAALASLSVSAELDAELQRAQDLLNFTGDPEAPSTPPGQATIIRAVSFIRSLAFQISTIGITLPTPHLSVGPDASVDIHWKSNEKELLMNVPGDPSAPIMFYGDDYGDMVMKGSIKPGRIPVNEIRWFLGK